MGGGGAQLPVWHVNEPKKTGARSARARTRGQNPLVKDIMCNLDIRDIRDIEDIVNIQNTKGEEFLQ